MEELEVCSICHEEDVIFDDEGLCFDCRYERRSESRMLLVHDWDFRRE